MNKAILYITCKVQDSGFFIMEEALGPHNNAHSLYSVLAPFDACVRQDYQDVELEM